MARKQAITKEIAAEPPARAAKPKTPRVKGAQHSKVSTESGVSSGYSGTHPDDPNEVIARIAYSFWESRGRQTGAALEDWVRAEHEYRQRIAATRL